MAKDTCSDKSTRRWVLLSGAALLAATPGRAVAGGDGGGGQDSTKKPAGTTGSGRGVTVDITPRQVNRMTTQQFKDARAAARKQGKVLLIEGFDLRGTETVIKMMELDERAAKRLLLDMRRLHTEEKRRARLEEEHRYQRSVIHKSEDKIYELHAENTQDARDKVKLEQDKIKRATRFRKLLSRWERDPWQGKY